jgi:ferredoxin
MRLEVDWTRCDGHGVCATLLPEQITRDEWGFPLVRPTPAGEQELRRTVAACPALALRLVAGR